MATEILKSFSHLQTELEQAKSTLKGVDENIKRLIGRDPSDLPPRPGQKRPLDERNSRQQFSKFSRGFETDDNLKRRNPNAVSVFKRLSDKVSDDVIKIPSRGLSKVIAAPKEVPSRQAVLDKQNKDEKFKARNKRMFGALLGTLQRFQQEESKQKKKEDKRTQIEKKIEEHEQQEKEEIKKERQELFLNRKKKQQEIKMIELKMLRMKEYAVWEQSQKPRTNFIATKAKPHIHYLPRKLNEKSKELLENSKKEVEEQIEKRRNEVYDELSHIEERMKRNFDIKNHIEPKEEDKTTDRHDRHATESEDEDGDIKMKSLSPEYNGEKEENGMKDEEIAIAGHDERPSEETENVDHKLQKETIEMQESDNINGINVAVDSDQSTINYVYDNIDNSSALESTSVDVNSVNSNNPNSGGMDYMSELNVPSVKNENVTYDLPHDIHSETI